MHFVAKKAEDDGRDTSIPIWDDEYSWWTDAIRGAIKAGGLSQKELAKDLGLDEGALSRAIRRKAPVWEIVKAVSLRFKVPLPALFPESMEEARHLEEQQYLKRIDDRLRRSVSATQQNAAGQPTGRSKAKRLRLG